MVLIYDKYLPENLVIEIASNIHLPMIKLINSNRNRIMY